MSTARRTVPRGLGPKLASYRTCTCTEACIRYWNNGPARSVLGMTYWSTSIIFLTSKDAIV